MAQPAAPPPQTDILVAGAAGVGKATLLRSLRATPDSRDAPAHSLLLLDTKYYVAQLLARCCGSSSSGSVHAATQSQRQPPSALILVVDAGSSSRASFDSAVCLYEQALAAHSCEEFEIQLLVANKLDTRKQQEADSSSWLQEARDWCCSNGFEYIGAAAGHPSTDAALQDEEGEQQGVARVLAALQAHAWPSMQPKKQQPQQHYNSSRDQGSAGAVSGEAAAAAPGVSPPAPVPPPAGTAQEQPSTSSSLDALPTKQQPKEHQQKQQQQQSKAPGAAAGAKREAAAGGAGADDQDPFLDTEVDDFEQLMRQVMGARVRLAGLPDGERRAAAADLALKLSSMMGLMGGGSEDEEGDDEEGDVTH